MAQSAKNGVKKKATNNGIPKQSSKQPRRASTSKMTLILCFALLAFVLVYLFKTSSRNERIDGSDFQHAPHGGMINEQASLEASDSSLLELLTQKLDNGDYFYDKAGVTLRGLEHVKGPLQFNVRCLLAFWHLHRGQFAEAKSKFDAILRDGNSPSHMSYRAVKLYSSIMHRLWRHDQIPDPLERMISERETLAELRMSLTLGESGREYNWMRLFETEGRWLFSQVPDTNNKDNSKCLYVPGLLAKEYHPTSHFLEAQKLEARFGEFMQELQPFIDASPFGDVGGNTAQTDADLVTRGRWADISLFSAGAKNADACSKLPMLCAFLEQEMPEVTKNVMGHALLSRLDPGTVLKRHHGTSNSQLTMHLGVIVPNGAFLEVNGKVGRWEVGKVLVFDDSFYHSVWHNGTAEDGPRLVLLLRGYHPEWTLDERAGLIFNHKETPWTMQDRQREVADLSTAEAKARWNSRKQIFQYGPGSRARSWNEL